MSDGVRTMDVNEIMTYLPHRYPFLLVDRIVAVEPGKSIRGIKNVTINEPFFQGHFPAYPVMPGVLVIEALAQVAAILSHLTADSKPDSRSLIFFAVPRSSASSAASASSTRGHTSATRLRPRPS